MGALSKLRHLLQFLVFLFHSVGTTSSLWGRYFPGDYFDTPPQCVIQNSYDMVAYFQRINANPYCALPPEFSALGWSCASTPQNSGNAPKLSNAAVGMIVGASIVVVCAILGFAIYRHRSSSSQATRVDISALTYESDPVFTPFTPLNS